jgi:hypothetical protein
MYKRLKLLLKKHYLLSRTSEINDSQKLIENFCLCCSSGLNCGKTKYDIKSSQDENLSNNQLEPHIET